MYRYIQIQYNTIHIPKKKYLEKRENTYIKIEEQPASNAILSHAGGLRFVKIV